MDIEIKKDLASNWFKLLQNAICDDISRLEKNRVKFKSTSWKRSEKKNEGGGEYRIISNGKVFEKVGVNFSKVYGKFPKKFQKNIPGASKDPQFEAGRKEIGKGGRVKEEAVHARVLHEIIEAATLLGFKMLGSCESSIQGKKSQNTEYFVHLEKPSK